MANVDFTLEDIRRVMNEEIRTEVPVLLEKHVPAMLLDFWQYNIKPAFDDVYEQLGNVEADVREIKREVKGQRRIVDQHSKDIMELRAAPGA